MSNDKRVWRPLNTYGIYVLSIAIASVIVYTLLEVSSACGAV